MIVCDQLVFIHLHKSGGTFVNQLLLQCLPSARQLGYHLPYTQLPSSFRALPVVGTVRNPWDYYVSWYYFQAGQRRPNPLFRLCSRDGDLGFAGTVRRLARLFSDDQLVEALRLVLPDSFGPSGLNLTKSCLDGRSGSSIGFYSFLFERMYAGAADLSILPAEHLRSGLREILSALSVLPNDRAEFFLERAPRLNVSSHDVYQTYYDEDLRDVVAEVEGSLIRRFRYEF